jgi:hypothetical protein
MIKKDNAKSDADSTETPVIKSDAIVVLSRLGDYLYDLKLNTPYTYEAIDKVLRLEKGTARKYVEEAAEEIDCDVKVGPTRFELKPRPAKPDVPLRQSNE